MTSWLLLGLFLVGAHRDSQHFAVQLDDEIEESPSAPAILASPENVSSVLASVNPAEPVRVHLLAGVYPNVTFTLPRGANLELQGEPGTKIEELFVDGDGSMKSRTELTLKSLQVMRVRLSDSSKLYSLALIDVAMEAMHDPGGDQAEITPRSRFATYLGHVHFLVDRIPSLTIQRSFLMPMRMLLFGENVTVLNSTIMLTDGIVDIGNSKFNADYLSISRSHLGATNNAGFDLSTAYVLAVATSTLANVTLRVSGNASIVKSNMTGKYQLRLDGHHSHVENSHFGACYGDCVVILSRQSALVGSTMQTAVATGCIVGESGVRSMEIRDMEIFDVNTPFLQHVDLDEGQATLDVIFSMVKFRNVWSAVKIDASRWKLTMQGITMEDVTNSGLTLQSRNESHRGIAQLRDVSMHNIMGVGLVLDRTIGNITSMTCRECNIGIAARASSLNMSGVDILGQHKQCNGIALKSSRLEANDVRMTNLAAGLLLKSSTVHLEDVFITDNALGVLPVNTTGTISGLVYFNDAADEMCEDHNGNKICPKVEHRSAAMKVHHSKALMLSLLACLVATISAVQGLKLLYTEKALSLRMLLWMLGCGLWPVVMIGAVNVLLVIWRAVQEQEAKQRPNVTEFVRPDIKMMWRLLFLLIWSAGGILYVFFDVFLNRHGLMLTGDARRRKELDEKKAQLKKRLDNQSLRSRMQSLHRKLFAALDRRKVGATEIFQEMKDLAEEEASNLAGWFEDQRQVYQEDDGGARMEKLEKIPSQDGEAVQPPLEEHYCDTEETETKPEGGKIKKSPVDALWMYASWLRADFKGQLSQLVADLNSISAKEVREFDEKLRLDPSLYRLQHEDGAEVGRHFGLMVASIKSKERAQAKINTDYQQDFEAGKKKEQPLARYVCDFLRATIYAADPFALALAFHEFQKRFKIVRVKNKFANEKLKTEERTNILVNFWVETEDMKQIGEVQFLMQEYLTAKSIQHMYYDVARAKSEDELLDKPIFA